MSAVGCARAAARHGISRLPDVGGDKANKRKFKVYQIGYFHIDIAELRSEEGKLYLFVAIDRTSKFAFVELHAKADRPTAGAGSVCSTGSSPNWRARAPSGIG